MKPREREEQKQTSRLFLRKKDHRDLILNDKYHNAIWISKDNKDELGWLKYPKFYFPYFVKSTSTSGSSSYGIFDANIQFAKGAGTIGRTINFKTLKLADYTVILYGSNPCTALVTQDGVVYKKTTFQRDSQFMYKFKENQFIYLYQAVNSSVLYYQIFSINEDDMSIIVGTYSNATTQNLASMDTSVKNIYTCETANGCIVSYSAIMGTGQRNITFYEVSENGVSGSLGVGIITEGNRTNQSGGKIGNFHYFCFRDQHSGTADFLFYYSTDPSSGVWEKGGLYSCSLTSSTSGYVLSRISSDAVYFYVFADQFKIFKTTNGEDKEEIIHPNKIIVPVLGFSGMGTHTQPGYSTLQINLIPTDETVPQEADIVGGFSSINGFINDDTMNVYFEDGERVERDGIGFYISGLTTQYWYVWLDNNNFVESDDNFAFRSMAVSSWEDRYAEQVQSDDYVFNS